MLTGEDGGEVVEIKLGEENGRTRGCCLAMGGGGGEGFARGVHAADSDVTLSWGHMRLVRITV